MKELNELVELAEKADAVANLMDNVNPHTILAIDEAFRELERRAKAAEADHDNVIAQSDDLYNRLMEAEAKLAELEKQEPVAWHIYQWRESPKGWDWYLTRAFASEPNNSDGWRSVALFTRPAPAVSLAELVPDEIDNWKNPATEAMRSIGYVGSKQDFTVVANWMRAAILRNIEDAGKKHE